MSDAERFEYVFGSELDQTTWYGTDHDERLDLLDEVLGTATDARRVVRLGVVEQLLSPEAPEVWATAQRLAQFGFPLRAVIGQLAIVLAQTAIEAIKGESDRTTAERTYQERLGYLPLPSGQEIEEAMLELASQAVVLPRDELIAGTIEQLGWPSEDPMIVQLIEEVEEELADEYGPLAWLSGDRTVHVEALCGGVVFTHVLSEAEREAGTLEVSFDLAGFIWVDEPSFEGVPLEPVSNEPDHLHWTGPSTWLEPFDVGSTLAVRVSSDVAVEIQVLAEEPPVDEALVGLVREAYEAAVDEPQLPVSGQDLVLGLLAQRRDAFDLPQASLTSLCHAAGLEKRASEVADDPEIWRNQDRLGRYARVVGASGGDEDAAVAALEALDVFDRLLDGEPVDEEARRDVLTALHQLEALALVIDELFDRRRAPTTRGAMTEPLLAVARRPQLRAVAHFLAALATEVAGDWAAAEQHLELAIEAEGSFVPAVDRLAWYVSDRGDASRAVALWRRCPPSPRISQDLANVESFTQPRRALGRNERCWCGSGRKYKQCHLGIPEQAPLADRVGWLCRKAVGYLERIGPEARLAVMEVVWARAADDQDWEEVFEDPLVMDLVLSEGGWFQRFLTDRGGLLPDDEALLATSWLAVDRSVHEILSVTPDAGLTIKDLRSGDVIEVRERTFTEQARVGTLICARAVPDGTSHQFIGALFPVAPGMEARLLDLLDGGDPLDVAAWVRALHAPPQLRNREGHEIVECEIVLATDDVVALVAHLDAAYEIDTPGCVWIEGHDLDEIETLLRARLSLEGDRLTITTNSNERADEILGHLLEAVDVTVVSDERNRPDLGALARGARRALPDLRDGMASAPPELPADAVEEIQGQMEARWCNESIPALAGFTPHQAAADPTRREQLERLLDSFDAMDTPPGAFSMRTDRLRSLLGL